MKLAGKFMKEEPSTMPVSLSRAASPANALSNRRFYLLLRKLHLYLGLFISPYLLVFALSTIAINHNWKLKDDENERAQRFVRQINFPSGAGNLEQAKDILRQLGMSGEIGYINHLPREGRLAFPVMKPGMEIQVDFDLRTNATTIEQHGTNFWKKLVYLHKSPGPHNANIRGNWIYTRWWRVLVDSVVYVLLFLTAGGIYLWAVIKAERKPGLICLGLGMACFFLIAVALSL
jgi:hypothetical protein